jgi:hypothetical protein
MKIHHKVRELVIRNEPAYDLRVIYLFEHFYGMTEDEKPVWLKTKILTKDGWRDHEEGVCFPIEKLPSISGRDLWLQEELEKQFNKWRAFMCEHLEDQRE